MLDNLELPILDHLHVEVLGGAAVFSKAEARVRFPGRGARGLLASPLRRVRLRPGRCLQILTPYKYNNQLPMLC